MQKFVKILLKFDKNLTEIPMEHDVAEGAPSPPEPAGNGAATPVVGDEKGDDGDGVHPIEALLRSH